MEFLQFTFRELSPEKRDIIIARLDGMGFTGYEEEGDILKAFIASSDLQRGPFDAFITDSGLLYTQETIKETNWNAIWESGFEPVSICYPGTTKPFVHLRAGFHTNPGNADYNIEITPKMSFGTGHHATTSLMIEEMSALDLQNKAVIDFGTGTGVLAILAEKLGANRILAIDYDDWSIDNANENILKNNSSAITLLKADHIPAGNQADIILANINLNIILENLVSIKQACQTGGTILFSGIMAHDEPVIRQAMHEKSITITGIRNLGNWLLIRVKV